MSSNLFSLWVTLAQKGFWGHLLWHSFSDTTETNVLLYRKLHNFDGGSNLFPVWVTLAQKGFWGHLLWHSFSDTTETNVLLYRKCCVRVMFVFHVPCSMSFNYNKTTILLPIYFCKAICCQVYYMVSQKSRIIFSAGKQICWQKLSILKVLYCTNFFGTQFIKLYIYSTLYPQQCIPVMTIRINI